MKCLNWIYLLVVCLNDLNIWRIRISIICFWFGWIILFDWRYVCDRSQITGNIKQPIFRRTNWLCVPCWWWRNSKIVHNLKWTKKNWFIIGKKKRWPFLMNDQQNLLQQMLYAMQLKSKCAVLTADYLFSLNAFNLVGAQYTECKSKG